MRILLQIIVLSYLSWQNYGSQNREYFDLIVQIKEQEPCPTMLHNLDSSDVSDISAMANNPILVVTNGNKRMQDILSSMKARCVTVIAQLATLDEADIEKLLNHTTFRRVYVFENAIEMRKLAFHDYFIDSVTYVQSLLSGNLMLYQESASGKKQNGDFIWLKSGKKLLSGPENNLKMGRRSTLRGRNVTVSAVMLKPYVTLDNGRYGGIEIDILNVVSKKMGFDYHIRAESNFVNKISLIGSVANGAYQIGFSSSFIFRIFSTGTPVELSPELYLLELVYIVPRPKLLTPYLNFVKPFTLTVWLVWLMVYLVCCIILSILIRRCVRFDRSEDKEILTLGKIIFIIFGSMWQQNLQKPPRSANNSSLFFVIFGFWIVAVTFKGAAYNCDLRSFIVKKEYEKPIDTDEDLLRTETDLYLPSGTGLPEIYRYSSSPLKREIYARAAQRETIMTYKDYVSSDHGVVRKIASNGGAVINSKDKVYSDMIKYEQYFGYQPFRTSKVPAFTTPTGWSIPLNQPWAEEFKRTILHILAGGIVNKITSDNIPRNKYSNPVKEVDTLEPYKLEHIAGPLILLAFGLFMSMTVACVEFGMGRYHKGSGRKMQNTYEMKTYKTR